MILFSTNIDWLSTAELNYSLPVICLQVVYNERGSQDRGVVSDLKKAQLI